MNILIVDDNANNRMILKLLLEDYTEDNDFEFSIDEAEDGSVAVKKCDEQKYDIVLMDIMMPVMDGIEATRLIRDAHPDIMIIAVSAVNDTDRQKNILSSGAEDYISKPVNSDIFTSRISNYITLVNARNHKRQNENYVNLFTKEIYSRNTKFMIHSEDSLSEFWEFFLLNAKEKYDGLSDIVRTIFSIADTHVRLSINSNIYVEESEDNQYFTLTDIEKLPPKIIDLILKKNAITDCYKISNFKISFEIKKVCSAEVVKEDVVKTIESTPVEIQEEVIATPIDMSDHVSKELVVFDYMDPDDLLDLEEYAGKLNSLLLIAGAGDITGEEIEEMYTYLDRLGSILSTYSDVYTISKALSELSLDMSNYAEEFAQNSEALGPICKAFSNDLSSWIQMSFHTGAPSVDFMNDTIAVNCQTISSMLKMNDEGSSSEDELDDIFDF